MSLRTWILLLAVVLLALAVAGWAVEGARRLLGGGRRPAVA